MEQEKSGWDAKGKSQVGATPARTNTDAGPDGGCGRSSEDATVMEAERRATVKRSGRVEPPPQRRSKSLPSGVKVFPITIVTT
jgi:hypothetical protein